MTVTALQTPGPALVAAARDGDQRARDEFVRACLPLVYNVVGRAAESDLDVDDIVQETMVRLVAGLSALRDPERARSWVVTIALRQLTEARSRAGRERVRRGPDPADESRPEPASGELRELTLAAAWLDDANRGLLALWWLEIRGDLTRAEVADALAETQANAAVRIQRLREQLTVARSVVRAVSTQPRCPQLGEALAGWNGQPSPLWRKRIARHLRDCAGCGTRLEFPSSPNRLLAALPLLVPPPHAIKVKAAGFFGGLGTKIAATAAAVLVAGGGGGIVLATHRSPAVRPAADQARVVPATAPAVRRPVPATPAPSRSAAASVVPTAAEPAAAVPPFRTVVPAFPAGNKITDLGPVHQNTRVAGRDNGQSTGYGGQSVWIFDDTTLKNPFGFLSNSAAVTSDLTASNGIDLQPGTVPAELIPRTGAEKAYEKAHPGVVFGFWPGPVIADPDRHRVLFTYGKLCRGAAAGTPCTGPLGKGLGMGIAAMDMPSGRITRLTAHGGTAVTSEEGRDPALFFGPGTGVGGAAAIVVAGQAYFYGNCAYGCQVARVPLARLTDLSAWRYYAHGSWVRSSDAADHLIGAGGAGQTVFYSAGLKAWINVFMPYGTTEVRYQVGGSPFGPWSADRTLTATSGSGNYALFAHSEYATDNGLTQYLTFFNPATGAQRLLQWRITP